MRNHRPSQMVSSALCSPELHDFSDWMPKTVRMTRALMAGLAFTVLILVGHLVSGTPQSEPASLQAQHTAQVEG